MYTVCTNWVIQEDLLGVEKMVYSLGPRSRIELQSVIHAYCEFDNECAMCNDIVLVKGFVCKHDQCANVFHDRCVRDWIQECARREEGNVTFPHCTQVWANHNDDRELNAMVRFIMPPSEACKSIAKVFKEVSKMDKSKNKNKNENKENDSSDDTDSNDNGDDSTNEAAKRTGSRRKGTRSDDDRDIDMSMN